MKGYLLIIVVFCLSLTVLAFPKASKDDVTEFRRLFRECLEDNCNKKSFALGRRDFGAYKKFRGFGLEICELIYLESVNGDVVRAVQADNKYSPHVIGIESQSILRDLWCLHTMQSSTRYTDVDFMWTEEPIRLQWEGGAQLANERASFLVKEMRIAKLENRLVDVRRAAGNLQIMGVFAFPTLFNELMQGNDDVVEILANEEWPVGNAPVLNKEGFLKWWKKNCTRYEVPQQFANFRGSSQLWKWKRIEGQDCKITVFDAQKGMSSLAVDSDGAFRFLDGEGDALSLFGVRLGQKMTVADTCPSWRNHLITARSDQFEYCRFTPSGEAGDTRFCNYTVCLNRTNRQVVAVFASTGRKSGFIDRADSRLTDFFGYVFKKLGNCETRIAEEMSSSGLMEWVFFFPSAKTGFIASSHTQFGEAVCLYDTDAMAFLRTGVACFVPDTPSEAKPWWGSYDGPAVELYRKHQSASNSVTSLFARQLAVSEKLLKSERIAVTTNKFANVQNVGCFDSVRVSRDSVYYSGAEAEYDLDGYSGSEISIDGRLYLFKSNGDAFNFGIAQLVNEPLPASVLAGKVKMLRDIPDMCFIRSEGLPSPRWRARHAGAVLIRANAVLVCEIFSGGTGDIGARLSTLLDFYGEFSKRARGLSPLREK